MGFSTKFYLMLNNILWIYWCTSLQVLRAWKNSWNWGWKAFNWSYCPTNNQLRIIVYGLWMLSLCIDFFFWTCNSFNFDIEINAAITLNCVGASMGEKPSLTKKLPATTTVEYQYYSSNECSVWQDSFWLPCFSQVGKLKFLCESFFMLKSMKLKLYLPEEVCFY